MLGRMLGSFGDKAAPAADPAPPEVAAPPVTEPPPRSPGELEERLLRDDAYFRRRQLEIAAQQVQLTNLQTRELLLANPALDDPKRLERSGGKTYSQNDEDGILAEIFRRIGAPHKTFIEFGCGNGVENNTLCLLAQGWRGLWMDGSEENAARIHAAYDPLIKRGVLQFKRVFIDRDNVDGLLAGSGLGAEIDLLSIDVDGNDFYLWEAIRSVSPRVVVLEYNGKFLPGHDWCMAYDAQHEWNVNDLMGCSLDAWCRLAQAKGYRLVGCNITGVNAFFVREDLAGDRFASPATPRHLFQPARYVLTKSWPAGHSTNTLTILQGAFASHGLPWPPEEGAPSFREYTFL